jgi:hypothetical protein
VRRDRRDLRPLDDSRQRIIEHRPVPNQHSSSALRRDLLRTSWRGA